jgi:hypothetical protein
MGGLRPFAGEAARRLWCANDLPNNQKAYQDGKPLFAPFARRQASGNEQ